MFDCPYCDAALTRTAVLALRLRKLAAAHHALLRHTEPIWTDCRLDPCAAARAALIETETADEIAEPRRAAVR